MCGRGSRESILDSLCTSVSAVAMPPAARRQPPGSSRSGSRHTESLVISMERGELLAQDLGGMSIILPLVRARRGAMAGWLSSFFVVE